MLKNPIQKEFTFKKKDMTLFSHFKGAKDTKYRKYE